MRRSLLLIVSSMLLACGSSNAPEVATCPVVPAGADFEVGSGESCFSALAASGGQVHLITGPQGGHHLWLSVRCKSCDSSLALYFGVIDPATGLSVTAEPKDGLVVEASLQKGADGYEVLAGQRAFMPDDEAAVVGKTFKLWAAVNGSMPRDERLVVVSGVEQQVSQCSQCN